ncbi:hypothetical protein AB0M28_12905 [Streptomyces sp. NPDC051940]|uniref:hypothetical protein n=1 Tax=Streptomyces sp. NPDC051940 TaxID=3155675 RepID=UPI00342E17BE
MFWVAFLLGIQVSLAANIAAAPALAWRPVLVAGWPTVALLPSVELLAHSRSGHDGSLEDVDPLLTVRCRRMPDTGRPIGDRSPPTRSPGSGTTYFDVIIALPNFTQRLPAR